MGIQFDSPDGPGSAKLSSDKSNCCGLGFLDGGFEGRTLSSSDVLEDVQEETDGSFSMRFLPLRLSFLFFLLCVSSSVSVSLPNSANKIRLYHCEIVVGLVSCVTDSVLHQDFNDFKLGFNLKSCFAGKS